MTGSRAKRNHINTLALILVSGLIASCSSSIEPMGKLGSNKVYAISKSNFLSASQMIVILNKKGNVAAYSGGTTSGAGTVALQTGGAVLSAGATVIGAAAIERGLEKTHVHGIPSTFHVKAGVDVKDFEKLQGGGK